MVIPDDRITPDLSQCYYKSLDFDEEPKSRPARNLFTGLVHGEPQPGVRRPYPMPLQRKRVPIQPDRVFKNSSRIQCTAVQTFTQKVPFLDYNKTKKEKNGTLWDHGLHQTKRYCTTLIK